MRSLFATITNYTGNALYNDVIKPWQDIMYYHDYLQNIAAYIKEPYDSLLIEDEPNWNLYALSRVLDVLTCALQYPSRYSPITLAQYISFSKNMGLTIEQPKQFHPFFYEIVDVIEGDWPFVLQTVHYPALFLGNLLINRGGATITLPSKLYSIESIKTAPLYWVYERNDREANDLSHGWGHNSQWCTSFRYDFKTERGFYYNFTGKENLNAPDETLLTRLKEDNISIQHAIDVVRYRQMMIPHEKRADLFPYDYRFFEKHDI